MKPVIILSLFILLATSLAGCQSTPEDTQDPQETNPFVPEPMPVEVDGCLKGIVCRADPSSHDAKYMKETYNLTQITADGPTEERPRIEGSLVIWQVSGPNKYGEDVSHLFAYNLSTGELIPIGWEDYYRQTRFEVNNGFVVFAQEPISGSPDSGPGYMMAWSEETRNRTRIYTGLEGEVQPFGFDYPWVVFRLRYSTQDPDGLYAHNLETNETILIYEVRHPDESGEALGGEAVADGFVYYEVHGVEVGEQDAWLYEYNLNNRSQRVVWEHYGNRAIGGMSGSDRYVVWQAPFGGLDYIVRYYDRITDNVTDATNISDESGIWIQNGGDWISYVSDVGRGYTRTVKAYHIPTGEKVVIVPDDRHVEGTVSATDGERVVVVVYREQQLEKWESGGVDLYWVQLPDLD